MSKNLTRKGLALGAVVALGSSLFAGTPANANPTAITFASAYGTSTTGILGEYFYFSTLLTGGANGNAVKFYVEGAVAADVESHTRTVTDLAATAASGDTYVAETEVATDNAAKITTVPVTSYVAGEYAQLALRLGAGVTATTSVKVTPFVDNLLADGKPTAGELTGSAITVNFVKASELTATPTLKAVSVGSALKATVALSSSVNVEQFRSQANGAVSDNSAITVKFATNGSEHAAAEPARWNTTDKEFVATSTAVTAAAVGSIYGAKAFVNTVASGSAAASSTAAGEVTTLADISVAGDNYRSAFNSSSNVVRAGAGSISLETEVTGVSTGKLKSGQKVTFKIEEQGANTLASGASITAGGKTLSNSSTTSVQSITVDVVSAADGSVSLPVSYTGLAAANQVVVSAYASPASGGTNVAAGSAITLVGQTGIAARVVDQVTSRDADSVRTIVRGSAFSMELQVVDQFGQVPAGSFRVGVAFASTGGSSAAPALLTPVAVSAGKVTISGTDNSTAAQTFSLTSTLQKLASDGVTWESSTTAGFVEDETVVSKFSVVTAAATAGSITVSASPTGTVSRAGETLVSRNVLLEGVTITRPTETVGTTLTTSVAATTGAALPGAVVTYSAAGVLFKAGNVWGLDSLTVNAKNDGTLPSVVVYSNKTGDTTITLTTGSVTKTLVVKFATPTSGGTAWSVTAPTSILPGQSLKVSAILRDKTGAPVNTSGTADTVKVEYTGPGFVTAAMPTTTNASGEVSFTVLLGAADSGTATVKITYAGADNITAATATDDVVATASIIIGAAPVAAGSTTAAIAGSTKRFFVSVSNNTAARNVVVKVAGRTFATLKGSTAAKRTYTVRAPKGSHKVTVFVGGKLIATRTISVK